MFQPPGSRDLAEELKALQRRTDELGRRSTQGPMCIVPYGQDTLFPNIQRNMMRPVVHWSPTPITDPLGMYHYNENGDTWIEIPFAGRWRIELHSYWWPVTQLKVDEPNFVRCMILLNGIDQQANVIGTQAAYHLRGTIANMNDQTTVSCSMEHMILQSGDKIRSGFWSRWGDVYLSYRGTGQAKTHISLRYLGPN